METQTIQESDSAQIVERKKRFALLLDKPTREERNTLNIMPEIIKVSGDKASKKILNRFLNSDEKQGFNETQKLLRNGWTPNRLTSVKQAYRFRLVIPQNLSELQEYALQEDYLKNVKVGKMILDIKDTKLIVAESENKIIHLSKNLTIDFRKAGTMSKQRQAEKMLDITLNH